MTTFTLVLILALLVGSMTAAATAVRSVSRIWLRHWAERQISGDVDQAGPALGRPHKYLLAAGTGIAAVVFAMGALVAFREDQAHLVSQLAVAAVMLLAVGQLLPRAIARRWGPALVPTLMPLLKTLDALFGPILGFAARMVRPLLRTGDRAVTSRPSDPLEDLLREAEFEGIGEASESVIISDVVEFGQTRVGDVMRPRAQLTSVTRSMPANEVADAVARSNYTRIPVFADATEEVLGVVHAFDVLSHPDAPLATLRSVGTATADELCGVVMRRMLRDHRHMTIVREAGGTGVDGAGGAVASGAVAGIVTLEDLVEELVGDIKDEHDEPGSAT